MQDANIDTVMRYYLEMADSCDQSSEVARLALQEVLERIAPENLDVQNEDHQRVVDNVAWQFIQQPKS